MRLTPLIITAVMAASTQQASAQVENFYDISFKIVDSQQFPISYSDVYLLNANDSQVVVASMPDENGFVQLTQAQNKYIIMIETAEFESQLLTVDLNKNTDLGTIILTPISTENVHKEVVIEGQKSVMELKIDKRVYNVGADINNQGATASEVLENIPSVTVDAEGNVSLRGNGNVRILVDGKLSGFASSADALKMLQADAIDRVEVVTNASSRYDAEGDAGVINIILKKDKSRGFNAIVNLRTGYYHDHGVGVRLNYKKNKVNLFADVNVNYSLFPGNSSTEQNLNTVDTQFRYFQTYNHERQKFRQNARVGMDYEWNAKNTTSIDFNVRNGDGNNTIVRRYENYNAADVLYNTDTRNEDQIEDESLVETNVSHTYNFKPNGSWRTAFSYFFDKDNETSDFNEYSSASDLTKIENSFANVTEKVMQIQSDFVYPISENGKIETGVRMQSRNFNNIYGYNMQVSPTEWEAPSRYNDDVTYDEKVYAAYIMGSEKFGDWGVQAGLRAEKSDIYTLLKSEDEKQRFDYFNLFPSAAVSYKVDDYNSLQWSLSRRIRRPGQWDLIPFRKFGDNREMMIGNTSLKPELTYSTEVTWMRYLPKGSVLSSLYYRRTTDKIERIAEIGTDGVIYRKPLNIASSDAMGAEFIFNYQIVKWLRLNTNFNLYHQKIAGEYNDQVFDRSIFSWTNRTSANVTLPYGIRTQATFQYEAPRVNAQGRTLHVKWMDIAISKDIMNQKATIGFNVRDLFNSRIHRQVIETPELTSKTHFQWRQRSFMLTFTYRFNQSNKDLEKQGGFFEDNQMD